MRWATLGFMVSWIKEIFGNMFDGKIICWGKWRGNWNVGYIYDSVIHRNGRSDEELSWRLSLAYGVTDSPNTSNWCCRYMCTVEGRKFTSAVSSLVASTYGIRMNIIWTPLCHVEISITVHYDYVDSRVLLFDTTQPPSASPQSITRVIRIRILLKEVHGEMLESFKYVYLQKKSTYVLHVRI